MIHVRVPVYVCMAKMRRYILTVCMYVCMYVCIRVCIHLCVRLLLFYR